MNTAVDLAGRRLPMLLASVLAGLALIAVSAATASAKSLGEWNGSDVDAGLAAGVTYLDNAANKTDTANIHWDGAGGAGDTTNTAFAIAAIGSSFKESPGSVTAAQLADTKNAVQWLLK